MTLITILGICATFFTILILMVHGTIIGVKTYQAHQQKIKAKRANMSQLITDCINGDREALKRLQQSILNNDVK